MKIGELARLTNCKVLTIRFYEKKGLMPAPDRTQSNYRVYGEEDLKRLKFIRHCRLHGMTLDEIKELISIANAPEHKCSTVHNLIDKHIKNITTQIAELKNLKKALIQLRDSCHGEQETCEVLTNLNSWEKCIFCSHNTNKESG